MPPHQPDRTVNDDEDRLDEDRFDEDDENGHSGADAEPLSDEELELAHEIAELVRNGRRVQAVKRYRELTGADLTDAVKAIDKIAHRHGIERTGCGPAVLALLVIALACAGLV